MIQRIQSIYLFVVTVIMIIPLFVPIAQVYIQSDANYLFYSYGVSLVEGPERTNIFYWPLIVLTTCTIALPFVTIFLYKKMFLQLRLCIVEIILLIGMLVLTWVHINYFDKTFDAVLNYKFSFILPVIAIIVMYLAMRGVARDIKLIKSLDRIR